jgi:hypothetical protein
MSEEEEHSPQEEDQPTTRILVREERKWIPVDYKDPYYSLTNQRFKATWNGDTVHSENRRFPWTFVETGKHVTTAYYSRAYPGYKKLSDFNYQILGGLYHSKKVRWNNNKNCWQYLNNQNVQFSDEESSTEESPKNKEKLLHQQIPKTQNQTTKPRSPSF